MPVPQQVAFLTGRLAEPALRRLLAQVNLPFQYEVVVMPITVAALMTTPWIVHHLQLPPTHPRHRSLPDGCDLLLIPGDCQGDVSEITVACGVSTQKGPTDLQAIPAYFGQQRQRTDYGTYNVQIMAEIQDALHLTEAALLERAAYYHQGGANVIDLGIPPDATADSVAQTVATLKAAGYQISVDSLDPAIIRQADAGGADYILSLNGHNLSLGKSLQATPVVIPDEVGDLASLWRNAEQLWAWGVDCILDPIAMPIGFGFSQAISQLYQTRERYPDAKLMIGAHHLSELTDADSTGINALMMGVAQELALSFVLTTEVAVWARGSVRELAIARQLMYAAAEDQLPPKHIDPRLLTIKDTQLSRQDEAALREMQAAITDPNFRLYVTQNEIIAFNHEVFISGTDPYAIFKELGVDDASHAFYLGGELLKAQLALQLGKTYRQDQPLQWGYLTPDTQTKRNSRVTLTQRF